MNCLMGEGDRNLVGTKIQTSTILSVWLLLFCSLGVNPSLFAESGNKEFSFSIPIQRADISLTEFARITGKKLLFPFDIVNQYDANEVVGEHSAEQALQLLLRDTGLVTTVTDQGNVIVQLDSALGKTKTMNKPFGILAVIAGIFTTTGVPAQSNSDGADFQIEEIIVTAQKREQSIQDVGTSITALSGNQIERMGLTGVTELGRHIPNMMVGLPGGDAAAPAMSIRGVGLTYPFDTSQSSIALYVDEVYQGTTVAQTAYLYDVDRVEVLRGPQGTLFGRNTTGGLVHFVSRKPTDELEAHGTFTYGRWDQIKFEGALSGPLGDRMQGRISVLHDENDGYQRDRTTGIRGVARDTTALRGQLAFEFNDEIDVLLNIHGSDSDGTPYYHKPFGLLTAPGGAPCTVEQVNAQQCFDDFGNRDQVEDLHSVALNPFTEYSLGIETLGGSAKITWQRDGWEFVSITALDTIEKKHREPTYTHPAPLPVSVDFDIESDQISQEARLSRETEDLTWLLGFYYYSDEKDGRFVFVPPLPYSNTYNQENEAWAVFAHAEWRFMPDWSLEAGVRYTSEELETDSTVDPPLFGPVSFPFSGKVDDDNVPWHVGLNWHVKEDVLLFANIDRGYKSGGINSGGFINFIQQLDPFDSEKLTMYEGGIKATLYDKRVRFNASGFYYDYKGFQALTQADIGGFPVDRLENVGDAEVMGFEAEVLLRPLDFFEAQFGVGYLDTETKNFFSAESFDAMGNPIFTDLSGTDLVYSPQWSANGLMRVFYPLFGGEAALQVDFSYSDEYFYDTDNSPLDVGGDVTIWNLRASWSAPNDRYEIAFWAQNFTDELAANEAADFFGGTERSFNKPRSIGVSVSARY